MRLFEYNYRLKAYLSASGRVPYNTGNLQANGFNIVQNLGAKTVALRIGGQQAPYAPLLETGFTHYRSGRFVSKHKGWVSRGAREFAQIVADELGGSVTYD